MSKVKFFYNYSLNIDITTDRDVEVYIDQFNRKKVLEGSIRVLILEEPGESNLLSLVTKYPDCYTHLLTYRTSELIRNPKARFFHCVETWVKGYVSPRKRFSVSTVVGGKDWARMEGYMIRRKLWENRRRIEMVRKFYLSGNYKLKGADYNNNLVLGDSKTPLFDSQYHIAIENTAMENYFSEKLIDCFQTLTVPIYYGASNIGKFFNIDGIMVANSVNEIVEACNSITLERYERMLPAMKDNFERSEKWCDHDDQIKIAIVELLKSL